MIKWYAGFIKEGVLMGRDVWKAVKGILNG
jgi:hypothetical protein